VATLFGKRFTRDEILSHVGDLSQVAGVRLMRLSEGKETDVRVADLRTGSGLRFQVTLDRGMDISMAEYRGIPLAWRSPVGDVHPAFFEPEGLGWLRSFPGGLMTGCGLTQAGAPCTDEGEELGLHGRLSHTPATDIRKSTRWEGDECIFRLEGGVRDFTMFGENLLLERAFEMTLGKSSVLLTDRVRNEADRTTPLMLLYHVNVGWPLLAEESRLLLHARETAPRDDRAAEGLKEATRFSRPIPGCTEQVYYHELIPDENGRVAAALMNSDLELGLTLRYSLEELPRFTEWKMTGEGTYVLGMEPANCRVGGRAAERAAGTLQQLEPGEERQFSVEIGILDGREELDRFQQENALR
jgi:hypothetical protein